MIWMHDAHKGPLILIYKSRTQNSSVSGVQTVSSYHKTVWKGKGVKLTSQFQRALRYGWSPLGPESDDFCMRPTS